MARAIGIVIDGEQTAVGVESEMEGVPEAGGDAFELGAVGPAAIDAAALAAARERRAVAADQLVGGAEVLAQAEKYRCAWPSKAKPDRPLCG